MPHVRIDPPHRTVDRTVQFVREAPRLIARRPAIAKPVAKPIAKPVPKPVAYLQRRSATRTSVPSLPETGFQPNPYVDYGRVLTAEGGILFWYKDFDLSFRQTLWRIFAWTIFTGPEAWFLLCHSPVQSMWLNLLALIIMAFVNWSIVSKPVEVYRGAEIRPDCMIIGGSDVFWSKFMEGAWPSFQSSADGTQVLSGIYGTRFVEYLTVRRFDPPDRTPEVFAAHLQNAMQQLWTKLI